MYGSSRGVKGAWGALWGGRLCILALEGQPGRVPRLDSAGVVWSLSRRGEAIWLNNLGAGNSKISSNLAILRVLQSSRG